MENNSNQALDYRDPSVNAFTLYVGALSCMRHRGEEFFQLQQEGRLAFLILNEIDYITGEYLDKIREAANVVVRDKKPEVLNIAAGCQSALLSSDYDLLKGDLESELGIQVRVDKNCHLNGYDHHKSGRGDHGDKGSGSHRNERKSREYDQERRGDHGEERGRGYDRKRTRDHDGGQSGEHEHGRDHGGERSRGRGREHGHRYHR